MSDGQTPRMQGKSFLNHISIGGWNLGEALDPNNNLDKIGDAIGSGDVGTVFDTLADMLDEMEERYDEASDLLESLIATGEKDAQGDLDAVRGKRRRMRLARRRLLGMQGRVATERRLTAIESRLEAIEH